MDKSCHNVLAMQEKKRKDQVRHRTTIAIPQVVIMSGNVETVSGIKRYYTLQMFLRKFERLGNIVSI